MIRGRIVVIDDEVNAAAALETLLREDGYEVSRAHDGRAGLELIAKEAPDLVLTDLRMPEVDGIELLKRVKEIRPDCMVILMTAYGTVKTAVKAMKLGAEDYVSKPIDMEELEIVLQKALEKKALLAESKVLRERLDEKYQVGNLVGESAPMLAAFKTVKQVAASNATVLLLGPSGTGKELFAQAIHQNSERKDKAFIRVACGALPETLLESELFGHEKGSFTGAIGARAGRFEAANGGTLFLDEIGDISLTVQVKLLRFLEEREFERVGGNRTIKVDVRIVAATHQNLQQRVKDGLFREDLFYRLNVIEMRIPPLRDRGLDVVLLAEHFLRRFAKANRKAVHRIGDDAMTLLQSHVWPGNVRELENAIERAVVLAEETTLTADHFPTVRAVMNASAGVAIQAPTVTLPDSRQTASAASPPAAVGDADGSSSGPPTPAPPQSASDIAAPGRTMAEIERDAITRALASVGGSTSRAAEILQISPRTIQYRLKEYQTKSDSK
jgi:two-component system NtrC family response regulator